jgi:hypothetical protein
LTSLDLTTMVHKFRLYWRRETGCDAGTPVGLEDLDAAIRPRVLELASAELSSEDLSSEGISGQELAGERLTEEGPIAIRLPFLDRREWRRRSESLRTVTLVREGSVIRHVPENAAAALRDQAAETIAAHPVWLAAPRERAPGYYRVWRNVSAALQEYLRRAVPDIYFRDPARYENRRMAWPLLVYQAMRPCRGVPGTEFTYDIANPETLAEALRMIRRPLQEILGEVQRRVAESGRRELSRRYAPVWHEDIVRAVQGRPRRLLAVLGDEAVLVDTVIALGAARNLGMVKPFVRQVMATLRSFYDCDMRELAAPLLAEATRALERTMQECKQERREKPKGLISRRVPALVSSRPVALRPITLLSPRAATDRSFVAPGTSGRCTPGSGASR